MRSFSLIMDGREFQINGSLLLATWKLECFYLGMSTFQQYLCDMPKVFPFRFMSIKLSKYAPGGGFSFMLRYIQSGYCFFLPKPKPAPLRELGLKQVSMQQEGSPLYLGSLLNLFALGMLYTRIVFWRVLALCLSKISSQGMIYYHRNQNDWLGRASQWRFCSYLTIY